MTPCTDATRHSSLNSNRRTHNSLNTLSHSQNFILQRFHHRLPPASARRFLRPAPVTCSPRLAPALATVVMAFLYAFSTPRTKPLHFEALEHRSMAAGIANGVASFFSSGKKKNEAALAAASKAPPGGAGVPAAASSSSSAVPPASDGALVSAAVPDFASQIVPGSPSTNLALASKARAVVATALVTKISVDPDVDSTRLQALQSYLPFIRTIHAQHLTQTDSEQTWIKEKTGQQLEWSSVLQLGARPSPQDTVPYFLYGQLNLGEELAHAYFNLGIVQYLRAGNLSFHALQLSNRIPPVSFLHLIPWVAKQAAVEAEAAGAAASSSSGEKKRMFNPLSYTPPAAPSTAPAVAKTPAEASQIRSQIIADRKLAVESLRTAAGIFAWLAEEYLPTVTHPKLDRRMIDTMPAISRAMELICLANVQQHTLLSAVLSSCSPDSQTPKPSPALLAKLAQGCVDLFSSVRTTLAQGTGSFMGSLDYSFHHFLRVSTELYAVYRLQLLGVSLELAEEHGKALAVLTSCLERLQVLGSNDEQAGINLAAIRDCNPVLSELKGWIQAEAARLAPVVARLKKDCEHVYFTAVPTLAAVGIPAGTEEGAALVMAQPLPFTPPEMLRALFLTVPDPEQWTGAAAGPAAAAAEAGADAAARSRSASRSVSQNGSSTNGAVPGGVAVEP